MMSIPRAAVLFASWATVSNALIYLEPKVTVKGSCVDPGTGVQPQVCRHAITGLSAMSNVRDAVKMFEYKKQCEGYGEKMAAEAAERKEDGATTEAAEAWECELDVQMRVVLAGIRDRCILGAGWEIPIELRELGFVTENYIWTNIDFEQREDFPKDEQGSLIFRRAFHDAWKPYEDLTEEERAMAQDHCMLTNYDYDDTFVVYKTKPEETITYNDLIGKVTLSRYEVREPETYEPMPYRKQCGLWGNFVLADSFGGYQEINGKPTGANRTYLAIDLSLYDPTKDDSVTTTSTEFVSTTEEIATTETTAKHIDEDKSKAATAKLGLTAAAGAGLLAATALLAH